VVTDISDRPNSSVFRAEKHTTDKKEYIYDAAQIDQNSPNWEVDDNFL
jgi:hypothetical protein